MTEERKEGTVRTDERKKEPFIQGREIKHNTVIYTGNRIETTVQFIHVRDEL